MKDFTLCDSPRFGRPKILQQRHLDFIDAKMEENDELTAIGEYRYLSGTPSSKWHVYSSEVD